MAVKGKSHFSIDLPMPCDYRVICTQELFDPEYGCEYRFGFVTFVYMRQGHIMATEQLSGINRKVDNKLVKSRFEEWKKRLSEDGKI